MDRLTFIAEIVKAMAWPTFLFLTLFVFRKPLVKLLLGIVRIRLKDLEIEIDRELLNAENHIQVTEHAAVADKLRHISAVAPTAAILEAWRDLEAAAADAAIRRGFSATGGAWELFEMLRSKRVLSEAQASAVDSLQRLKNKVVHVADAEITEKQAMRYIEIAAVLAAGLRGAT